MSNENTRQFFSTYVLQRDSKKASAPVVFNLGGTSVHVSAHIQMLTYNPSTEIRFIWSGLGLVIFSRWFSKIVQQRHLEGFYTNPAKQCRRSQTLGLVNGLPGRGGFFQTTFPSDFTSTPLRTTTLGKPKAKMKEAAAASRPGVLGKGLFVHFTHEMVPYLQVIVIWKTFL